MRIIFLISAFCFYANMSLAQQSDSMGGYILRQWTDSFGKETQQCDPYSNLDTNWINEHPDSICAFNARSYDTIHVFQISSEIGRFTNIQELTVHSHRTKVQLPHEIGQLQRLKVLMIYSCLQGDSLPASLLSCDSLTYLLMFCLATAPKIPGNVNQLKGLRFLSISLKDNHSPSMYRSLLNLEKSKSLQVIDIHDWPYSKFRKNRFIRKMRKQDCYVYIY